MAAIRTARRRGSVATRTRRAEQRVAIWERNVSRSTAAMLPEGGRGPGGTSRADGARAALA